MQRRHFLATVAASATSAVVLPGCDEAPRTLQGGFAGIDIPGLAAVPVVDARGSGGRCAVSPGARCQYWFITVPTRVVDTPSRLSVRSCSALTRDWFWRARTSAAPQRDATMAASAPYRLAEVSTRT